MNFTKKIILALLTMALLSATVHAEKKGNLYYEMGISGGIFDFQDKNRNVIGFTSKTGYHLTNNFSAFMLGEGVFYRYNTDTFNTGMSALGLSYYISEEHDSLSFSIAGGLAQNLNYSSVMSHFKDSFTFGTALRASIDYKVSKNISIELSHSQYRFTDDDFDAKTTLLSVSYGLSFEDIVGMMFAY